jgi:DNA-binding transcriptional LysR family regulator
MDWEARIGRRLTLRDLHVFLTVAELGSMGRASEKLAISQPSISKAIAAIEHILGVRLLERSKQGVELTPYGEALRFRGLGAFDELKQSIVDIESLNDPMSGEVRIGCPEAIGSGLMSPVLRKFSRSHPKVRISITAADNMAPAFLPLRNRSVDALIGRVPPRLKSEDVQTELLYSDTLHVVVSQESEWARKSRVTIRDLADAHWILFPQNSWIHNAMTEAFDRQNCPMPHNAITSFSVHLCINLLVSTGYVAALSGSVLKVNGARFKLLALPIELNVQSWRVGIVTLKNRSARTVVEDFLQSVRSTVSDLGLT